MTVRSGRGAPVPVVMRRVTVPGTGAPGVRTGDRPGVGAASMVMVIGRGRGVPGWRTKLLRSLPPEPPVPPNPRPPPSPAGPRLPPGGYAPPKMYRVPPGPVAEIRVDSTAMGKVNGDGAPAGSDSVTGNGR